METSHSTTRIPCCPSSPSSVLPTNNTTAPFVYHKSRCPPTSHHRLATTRRFRLSSWRSMVPRFTTAQTSPSQNQKTSPKSTAPTALTPLLQANKLVSKMFTYLPRLQRRIPSPSPTLIWSSLRYSLLRAGQRGCKEASLVIFNQDLGSVSFGGQLAFGAK